MYLIIGLANLAWVYSRHLFVNIELVVLEGIFFFKYLFTAADVALIPFLFTVVTSCSIHIVCLINMSVVYSIKMKYYYK
jgi:hypothetical protein